MNADLNNTNGSINYTFCFNWYILDNVVVEKVLLHNICRSVTSLSKYSLSRDVDWSVLHATFGGNYFRLSTNISKSKNRKKHKNFIYYCTLQLSAFSSTIYKIFEQKFRPPPPLIEEKAKLERQSLIYSNMCIDAVLQFSAYFFVDTSSIKNNTYVKWYAWLC